MSLFHFLRNRSSFNPFVVSVTLSFVLLVISIALFIPQQAETVLNAAKTGIFKNFSWFYILAFSAFFFFLLALSVSSLGNIKLGSNEEEPEFSFWSWLAMLFAAGMGVGLMFFGVAEPLTHYLSPITEGGSGARQQDALLHTLFHWGVHAWSVYAAMALALAYFAFRYKLPLSLRSCFYPLLKEKIDGKAGDIIDILALVATLFGIITTLGFGAAQLGAGLAQIGWISENTFSVQTIVIFAVMGLAVASAASGIGKGVKMLSEMNLTLAFVLMVFVLATGPTLHLLSAFNDNLGTYLSNLVQLSFKTYSYEQNHTEWFGGWTILYWAWWCSWAPFVGLFIARISRGRTIREFIFGVLAVPSLFCVIWFTIFGDTAIWINDHTAAGALGELTGTPEKLLFRFLEYLPLPTLTGLVSLMVIALFFITSAVFDKLFGHFALDGFNAVHEVAQGLFVDGEFDGRLFAVEVGLDIDAQAVFVGQLLAQFAHGGQGGGFEEFEDVLFLCLVQHTLKPVLPVVAAPIDTGGGDGGREVFVVGV